MPGVLVRKAMARVLVLLWAGLAAPGCAAPNQEGPGHRAQTLALTPEQELSLGEQAYKEVLAKSHLLPAGDPRVKRVREVGRKIAKAAEIEPLQREINLKVKGYRFDWEFNVLDSKEVNAFCLPGGKVAVYSGLLPVAENDDQLATVMAHEIAHALAHHASERIAREEMYEKAINAVGGALGSLDPNDRKKLIGLLSAGAGLRGLAYDRKQESEADHIGLFLMAFAGYDPDQAIAFWERMEQLSEQHGRPPEILSDHPSDAHRIADIQKWAVNAKAAKKAFDEGRIAPPPGR